LNAPTPPFILGRTKSQVLREALERVGDSRSFVFGPGGLAARLDSFFLGWGITPSPLAQKVFDWMLSTYAGEKAPPRRFFYTCYAGTHASILGSCLHVGLLPPFSCDLSDDDYAGLIENLPFFDRRSTRDIGVPLFMGEDSLGSEVYAVGTGWLSRDLEMLLCDLIRVASPRACACFCSVRGFLDFPARLGGFLSRRVYLVHPGRKMIARSLSRKVAQMRRAVNHCLDLSAKWKDNERQSSGEVIWIDAKRAGRAGKGSQPG